MNPLVLLLLGGAGYLLYNYFTEDGSSVYPVSTPVGTGQQTVQAVATPPTIASQIENLADKLKVFAGATQLNFWQWEYYMKQLTGKAAPPPPDGVSWPMFQGMDVAQIERTMITAEQFVAMISGNPGLGNVWTKPGRYLSLSDRGIGGSGPSGFEKLSTTFRRYN